MKRQSYQQRKPNRINKLVLFLMLVFGTLPQLSSQPDYELVLLEIQHPEVVNLGCEFPITCVFQNIGEAAYFSESWQLELNLSSVENAPSNPLDAEAELSITMPPMFLAPGEIAIFQRNVPVQWGLFDETDNPDPEDLHRNIVIVWGGEIIQQDEELLLKSSELDVSPINTGVQEGNFLPDPEKTKDVEFVHLPEFLVEFQEILLEEPILSATFHGYWSFPFFSVRSVNGNDFVYDLDQNFIGSSDQETFSTVGLNSVLNQFFPTEEIKLMFPFDNFILVTFESGEMIIWDEEFQIYYHDEEFLVSSTEQEIPTEILEFIFQEFGPAGFGVDYTPFEYGFGYTVFTESGEQIIFDSDNNFIYSFNDSGSFYETIPTEEIPPNIQDLFFQYSQEELLPTWFFTSSFNCDGFYSAVTEENETYVIDADGADIQLASGLQESLIKDFQIYPNPTEGKLHIATTKNCVQVSIYSLDGQLVHTVQENDITSIQLSSLAAGNYLLKAFSKDDYAAYEFFSIGSLGR